MSSVFLSHSHADKLFARRLAADLRKAGHAVWIDEAEINIGDSLVEKIRDGIDQVDFVAAILSSSSISSPWVIRELDIASNREMEERRVVVLPLMLEQVELPGFLKGKYYGDFTNPSLYGEMFALLIRKLGPATAPVSPSVKELAELRAQLAAATATAAQHENALQVHQRVALRGKSPKLVKAIIAANMKFPSHAPINTSHAFESCDTPVTLDYLLWAIAKSGHEGSHPLEVALSIDEKWPAVHAMLSAYGDLLSVTEG